MIYTLTLNPAIDYYLNLDLLTKGQIHRSTNEHIKYGGKGINVSLILGELGIKSTATGFLGGFTGKEIENGIKCSKIDTDFVYLSGGNTRINVKIRDGVETDINASGPEISADETELLLSKLSHLEDGDALIMAGSVPPSLHKGIYELIMSRLSQKKIKFTIDTERDTLLGTLKYKPFLIKPNKDELSDIFGVQIGSFEDALTYAKKLQQMGAENVLVSMGDKGAVLTASDGSCYTIDAVVGCAVNTVGAGDSSIAGFLAGYFEKEDFVHALKLACACGSATAFSDSLACRADIFKLFDLYDTLWRKVQ